MIEVKRQRSWSDQLRNYDVILDGKKLGTVGRKESCSFHVEPGRHTIHLEIDWCRSKKIEFESRENETISFNCGGLKGIRFLFLVWYITFGRSSYLWLKRV
ncbi:hypothetical protein SAMN05421663_106171 [Terribacillus halophilus]|uniref:PEGA domain-containing protein n=1 Tax=Terribacillus halophilus TaxID=361279 RepID=A0A1G6RTR4_9BACI|nr:hypothetical protein [Terribacillus halophilus]SDD07346.1 hypothetical protein SAMN05421663_106171 [Terribacillus halophilus]